MVLRVGCTAPFSAGKKESPSTAKPGTAVRKAEESRPPSNTLAGTAGTAGSPEQNAPEQGRGREGSGSWSDEVARSCINDPASAEDSCRSARDVTRCEQPASATGGANRAQARNATTAPARRKAGLSNVLDFMITTDLHGGTAPTRECKKEHVKWWNFNSVAEDTHHALALQVWCGKTPILISWSAVEMF
jgi:hypothetical protein